MADKDFTSNKATKKARKVASTSKARLRSKSRINPKVIANIVFINPETRKQQAYKDWQKVLRVSISVQNYPELSGKQR